MSGKRPKMRVQRTRSSPSALRSLLTRHPLGRSVNRRLLPALLISTVGATRAIAQTQDVTPTPVGQSHEAPAGERGANVLISCSESATVWIDGRQVGSCTPENAMTVPVTAGRHALRAQGLESPLTNWLEIVNAAEGVTTVRLIKGGKSTIQGDVRKPDNVARTEQGIDQRDLPQAPTGFHWERAAEIKAALLVPDGWFFRTDHSPTRHSYFVSREDTHAGNFKVGLSVNVNRGVKGQDAVAYAKKVVAAYSKGQGKTLRRTWDIDSGLLAGAACDVDVVVGHDALVMELVVLGNARTNVVYYVTFEAPATEWDAAWQFGREIMSHLRFNDEF